MRRRWLVGGGLALVVAVAVAIAVQPAPVMSRGRLERVRESLTAERARHFTATVALTGTSPAGARLDAHITGQGDLRADQAHSAWKEPGGLYEEVLLGDELYSRWASDQPSLDETRWRLQAVGHDEGTGRSLGARALFEPGAGAPDLGLASPANLTRLLGQLDLRAGSGRTITGSLPFNQLFPGGSIAARDGSVSVELTAGDDGTLDRMRWTVTGHVASAPQSLLAGDFSLKVDVEFTAPPKSTNFAAPPSDQVDRPGAKPAHQFVYDPPSVAQVRDFSTLAPTSLPDGFRLVGASVEPGDERHCTKVALRWEDPLRWAAWLESDHLAALPENLEIRQYRASCLGEVAAPGDPFQAGPYRGTIALPFEEYDLSTVYLTVGDTHLVIKSDLPLEQFRTAVASIKPFDPTIQPLLKG